MSGTAGPKSTAPTTKATTNDAASTPQNPPKPSAQLEEDDEFEDFPVEDWGDEDTDMPGGEAKAHLWEESWDDDDTSEDFAKMLKEELKKVEARKAEGQQKR